MVAPANGEVLDTFLTATLEWEYPICQRVVVDGVTKHREWRYVRLKLSKSRDFSHPVIDVIIPENVTRYRMAVVPETTYYWQILPIAYDGEGEYSEFGFRSSFNSGKPRIDTTKDDAVRYRNPRRGAHFEGPWSMKHQEDEPLSPWYAVKSYRCVPSPRFEDLKDNLPVPILEGHDDAIEAYWYCWKTLMEVWHFAPDEPDHQAVANICGIRTWGHWGCTVVWDTACMFYFAKYGHQVYPFIEGFDNCYARQHENGFILRATDRNNRETYGLAPKDIGNPSNPPLFAWIEWEYYKISNDKQRLCRILLPIVKLYEWWMIYQRRENGIYWNDPGQESDDSMRTGLMYYSLSAASYQALAALHIARIAKEIGRDDLAEFFNDQHRKIGEMVNSHFWDEEHEIYNDLNKEGKPITESTPGVLCKHCHMFWPLLAKIVPDNRINGIVKELTNPSSFYRRNGVPSLSADSEGYTGGPLGYHGGYHGQYWRGAVWPCIQNMVQEGLRNNGKYELAREIASKYFNAIIEVYQKIHDITENLAPDRPLACGHGQFVGWGGIGPIANLIEYIIGLDIHVPEGTIIWRINQTAKHGIKNLKFREFMVGLICDAREKGDAPCHITVNSGGDFKLIIDSGGKRVVKCIITRGNHQIHVK